VPDLEHRRCLRVLRAALELARGRVLERVDEAVERVGRGDGRQLGQLRGGNLAGEHLEDLVHAASELAGLVAAAEALEADGCRAAADGLGGAAEDDVEDRRHVRELRLLFAVPIIHLLLLPVLLFLFLLLLLLFLLRARKHLLRLCV